MPILFNDLFPVRHPVPIPAPQRRRVVHANRVDVLDFKAGALERVDDEAERRRRVRAGEDVLVHEQAPDEVFVLPRLAQPRNLQEKHAVVVEHVVHLPKKPREVAHAHMLGHFEAGDFVIAARGHGDVAVVHAQDAGLRVGDAGLAQAGVAPGGLVAPEGDAGDVRAVVGGRVLGERAPAAADVEHALAAAESDLLAHDAEFIVLQLLERLFLFDVGNDSGGVGHARAEKPAVEVVAAVVVVAHLLFVYGGEGTQAWISHLCDVMVGSVGLSTLRTRMHNHLRNHPRHEELEQAPM